tara:strand:- start:2803 stop:4530 length:1728 start_codon:yes stop_codon:yes gene_type:complete
MAIDELGQSLSSAAAGNRERREKEASKRRKKDMLREFAGKAVVGGVKNFFETRQSKNAFAFMQREPIIAARAKFNQGVDAAIQQRTNWSESSTHAGGHEGWWYDKLQPQFRSKMLEVVDEKDYTKDGFDSLVRQETNKYINNTALPAYIKANNAANRMTADKTAFDKYVELNDGLPDSAVGSVFKGIGNIFKGKDAVALKQQARAAALSESSFVNKAEAMIVAQQAINKGYNVKEAKVYAQMLDQYLIKDQDYNEINREDVIKSIKRNGQDHSVEFTKITKEDDHGRQRVIFEAKNPEDSTLLQGNMNLSTKTDVVLRNGQEQQRTYKQLHDPAGHVISTVPEYKTIGVAPGGFTSVTDKEADDSALIFREQFKELTLITGGDEKLFEEYENFLGEYLPVNDKDNLTDSQYTNLVRSYYKKLIYNGGIINTTFGTDTYKANERDLSQTLSRFVEFNDMRRVADIEWYDSLKQERSTKRSTPSPLEILEAIGTVREFDGTAKISKTYINKIANSEEFKEELANSDKDRLNNLIDSFVGHQNMLEYSHLYDSSILISPIDGSTVSIFDFLTHVASKK